MIFYFLIFIFDPKFGSLLFFILLLLLEEVFVILLLAKLFSKILHFCDQNPLTTLRMEKLKSF